MSAARRQPCSGLICRRYNLMRLLFDLSHERSRVRTAYRRPWAGSSGRRIPGGSTPCRRAACARARRAPRLWLLIHGRERPLHRLQADSSCSGHREFTVRCCSTYSLEHTVQETAPDVPLLRRTRRSVRVRRDLRGRRPIVLSDFFRGVRGTQWGCVRHPWRCRPSCRH